MTEVGVYLKKEVEDVFDRMLKAPRQGEPGVLIGMPESTIKKVTKIIKALRERYANAPNYLEKVTLSRDTVTPENLARVLGESMFGSKKATRDFYGDFSTLFSNYAESTRTVWDSMLPVGGPQGTKIDPTDPKSFKAGQKVEHEKFGLGTVLDIKEGGEGTLKGRVATVKFDSFGTKDIALQMRKMRVLPDTRPSATEDAKSVRMELSDEFWEVLDKVDHPVGWALVNFVQNTQKRPGQNLLAIKRVDIDRQRPDLLKVVFVNGKKTTMPAFNMLKLYFGNRFDSTTIDEFVDDFSRIVNVASHQPSEVVEVRPFRFEPKNVRETFLSLTRETYPRGHEEEVVRFLGPGLTRDEFGNYYRVIGRSDVMFTSHLDTVSTKSKVRVVSRVKDGDEILSSDGASILGADDKAGVTVMLYMMAHEVPGVYYFFVGEESGGIGSGKVASAIRQTPHLSGIRKCVSFDRKNYFSVITQQMYEPCCSDEFADALCAELNRLGHSMGPDPTGVFTDSANFLDVIPECTNISVGYFNEHTRNEALNVSYLERLAKACVEVRWGSLPVARSVGIGDDVMTHWGDVVYAIEDTGFNNDLKIKGDSKKLVLSLHLDSVDFKDAYKDLENLDYIVGKMRLDAKVTFDTDHIKIEIRP